MEAGRPAAPGSIISVCYRNSDRSSPAAAPRPATLAVVLFFALVLSAAGDEPDTDYPDNGWIALPSIGYSPENGFILGAAAQYYSVPAPAAPTDSVGLNAIYGTEGIFSAGAVTNYRFAGNGLLLEAGLGVSRSSDEFAGIGRRPRLEDDPEEYEVLEVNVVTSLLFPLTSAVSVGPVAGVTVIDIRETEQDGLLETGDIAGSDGAVLTPLGVRARYDARDSNVYTTRGFYADVLARGFMPEWGSSSRFGSAKLDLRGFYTPVDNFTFGAQVTSESVVGEAPFQGLATFGGANIVRGVRSGRYRDNHAVAGQLELRSPMLWRFRGVLFAGAATVGDTPATLIDEPPVAAGGAGIRFAVASEQNQNLRLDIAWDGESISPYINFGEAF